MRCHCATPASIICTGYFSRIPETSPLVNIFVCSPGPDADNAIQSRDGKKLLDEVIHLMDKNNKLGLVKLVEDDENIETVVFSTERCTSTLSLSDVAALGAGDTPFTLSHSGSTASFIVGGADHSALLR